MNTKVKVQIIKSDEKTSKEVIYKYRGRLLGLADNMEATKIVNNWKVASRVFTGETKKLEDVTELAESKTHFSKVTESLGHLIITIDSMTKGKDSHLLTTLSKQLLVSPPITMISEIGVDRATDLISATIECADDSLLTIKEIKND